MSTPEFEFDTNGVLTVGHITLTRKPGDRMDGECSICQTGINVGPSFGPIPGDVLLAEWIKQHTHTKKGAKR